MGIFRLFLALSVVLVHCQGLRGQIFFTGGDAVKLFFAISGFYMTLVLSTKYKTNLRDFYINRILRIYPIYWVCLAMDLIFILHTRNIQEWHTLAWPEFLYVGFANIFLFGQDWMYFVHTDATGHFHLGPIETIQHFYGTTPSCFTMEGQAWTLGLECTFYLLVPLLVKLRTRWLMALILVLSCLRVIVYFYLMLDPNIQVNPIYEDRFGYRFFPFELPFFLSGMVAYRIYAAISSEKRYLQLYWKTLPPLLILGYIIHDAGFTFGEMSIPHCEIIYFIPLLFIITKNSRLDEMFGAFSYPVYISHFFVSRWLMQSHPHVYQTWWGYGAVAFMASMVFSIFLIKIDDLLHCLKREPSKYGAPPQKMLNYRDLTRLYANLQEFFSDALQKSATKNPV